MLPIRCTLLGAVLLGIAAAAKAPPDQVEVKVVKYADLGTAVRQHLGQVVLLDFWGIT